MKTRVPVYSRPSRPGIDPRMPDWSGHPAPPLGSSDLDPLGRFGGGGMLMDPQAGRHRDIEPRWDPVGPMGPLGPSPLGPGRSGDVTFQTNRTTFLISLHNLLLNDLFNNQRLYIIPEWAHRISFICNFLLTSGWVHQPTGLRPLAPRPTPQSESTYKNYQLYDYDLYTLITPSLIRTRGLPWKQRVLLSMGAPTAISRLCLSHCKKLCH